jgi:hypothetical protein
MSEDYKLLSALGGLAKYKTPLAGSVKPVYMNEEEKTPEGESISLEKATLQAPVEEPKIEETKIEETIGEALQKAKEDVKKDEQRLVPEAVLLEYKNQNKELKRDIKELKTLIESGASPKEISEDLRDIASEHNIDPEFLRKLSKSIKQEAEKDLEARFETDIRPIKEKERAEKMEVIFNEHYNKTLEVMPEFKDVANRDIIKQLSLLPANANKTFSQILQETYGHLVGGKRTMETARARKGDVITDIDYDRTTKDQVYLKEILSDPELKKKYNESLTKRLRF